jgi:hypothetical protein
VEKHLMQFLQNILTKALPGASVKSTETPHDFPIAVRPITGLQLAPAVVVRRLTLVAWFGARRAVRANVPELTYLRTQHALYRTTTPRDVTAPIPETAISATGELVVTSVGDARHPNDIIFDPEADLSDLGGPVAAEAAYQRNASEAAGMVAGRNLEEKESDLRTIDRQLREREDELEQLQAAKTQTATAQIDALEIGSVATGKQVAPPLWKLVLSRTFELGLVAGETTTVFPAIANTAGLDPSNLPTEWANGAALAIVICGVAAVTLAALMFVIARWGFAHMAAAVQQAADPARGSRLATATALLIFDACVVAAISYLRAQLGTAGDVSIAAACFYFITGAAPLIGGALVHLDANALAAQRREALRSAGTPGRPDLAQRQRMEREGGLIAERDRLRARRAEIVNAIQKLNAQMHGAEQAVRDIARWETSVVLRWLDSLRSALAKDQKHFQHFARIWNRQHLLAETATATPQTVTVVSLRTRSVQ